MSVCGTDASALDVHILIQKLCHVETWGIEPQTSSMRSQRSTTELCPHLQPAEGLEPSTSGCLTCYETYALTN